MFLCSRKSVFDYMAALKGADLKDAWIGFTLSNSESDFYTIYSHYHHYLNYVGVKRGFAGAEIKDSISDVFLYLWENRERLQRVDHHHNYIITSFLRKLYRKSVFNPEEITEMDELPDWLISPSVEDLYIKQDMDETVSQLVKEKVELLADKQRHIIYQKFYLGLSYQEIATANDISINTVYNTIYKATGKLKSLMTKEQEAFLSLAISITFGLFSFFFKIQ